MHNFLRLLTQFFEKLEFYKTKKMLLLEMGDKNFNNKVKLLDDIQSNLKRLFRKI